MGFLKEFKDFAMKGNVLDLAVAVIIGGAFGKIVTALTDNILMPLVAKFMGENEFAAITLGGLKVGLFIQAVVDFLIVAFVLFLIIKGLNSFKKKEVLPPVIVELSSTDKLLMEIRDELKKK